MASQHDCVLDDETHVSSHDSFQVDLDSQKLIIPWMVVWVDCFTAVGTDQRFHSCGLRHLWPPVPSLNNGAAPQDYVMITENYLGGVALKRQTLGMNSISVSQ